MHKSTNDILCGLSFLVIALVFYIQLEELSGISRVFPESLLALIAIGGAVVRHQGVLGTQEAFL